jgi:hypothetical protein
MSSNGEHIVSNKKLMMEKLNEILDGKCVKISNDKNCNCRGGNFLDNDYNCDHCRDCFDLDVNKNGIEINEILYYQYPIFTSPICKKRTDHTQLDQGTLYFLACKLFDLKKRTDYIGDYKSIFPQAYSMYFCHDVCYLLLNVNKNKRDIHSVKWNTLKLNNFLHNLIKCYLDNIELKLYIADLSLLQFNFYEIDDDIHMYLSKKSLFALSFNNIRFNTKITGSFVNTLVSYDLNKNVVKNYGYNVGSKLITIMQLKKLLIEILENTDQYFDDKINKLYQNILKTEDIEMIVTEFIAK